MTTDTHAAEDVAVLRAVLRGIIDASDLSDREWARLVSGRDPRTIQRWLAGEVIPHDATEWLARIVRVTASARTVTVVVRR